jgi:hypothetical protein
MTDQSVPTPDALAVAQAAEEEAQAALAKAEEEAAGRVAAAPPAPAPVPAAPAPAVPAEASATALVETWVENPGELRRVYPDVQRPDGSTLELGPGESAPAMLALGYAGSLYLKPVPAPSE